ncbi:TPA: histone H1 [Escherichia coli]|nr:histone H1 [Escherichia coli]HBB2333479.1 histone H1 [Escherichia coli]
MTIYITELVTGLLVIAGLFIWVAADIDFKPPK